MHYHKKTTVCMISSWHRHQHDLNCTLYPKRECKSILVVVKHTCKKGCIDMHKQIADPVAWYLISGQYLAEPTLG